MRCPNCGHELSPKRKREHSNLFHKVVGHVASKLGIDPEVLKMEIKLQYGTWVYAQEILMDVPEWPGRFVETGSGTTEHLIRYVKSEAAYNKDEENAVLDGVLNYAWQNGVDIEWLGD